MGALGERVMGRDVMAVGYGIGIGRWVIIEVSGESGEEVDVELIDVISVVVKVSGDDVKDRVTVVGVGA